jgi:hypothetical protein
MSEAIEYVDLNTAKLTALFERDGSVCVRLEDRHARACAALINTWISGYSMKDAGFARRIWMTLRGLWVIARVSIFHSRLMQLTPLLILQEPQWRTTQESDGQVFLFERRAVQPASAAGVRNA